MKGEEKYRQILWLADYLNRRGPVSLDSIKKDWLRAGENIGGRALSDRTFFSLRRKVENTFRVDVECNGFNEYYIANPEALGSNDISKWMLDTMSLGNIVHESADLSDRVLAEEIPSGYSHLPQILDAMRQSLTIEIEYRSFWSGDTPYVQEVDPYAVKAFRQRWYLLAYSHKRKALRTYGLDRIVSIVPTFRNFTLPEGFSAEGYFNDWYGVSVFEEAEPMDLRLRVTDGQQKYLRTLPLHHSQHETKIDEDSSIFTFRICDSFELRHEILSHGSAYEVIEPAWFREEIAREILAMAEKYK